jgi:dTDP-4-amino-4,6-dideoxygalactose transaminase
MTWKVPFFNLQLGDEEIEAVCGVIRSNWLTAGPKIAEFESEFVIATEFDTTAVAVSSATAALHLSLLAIGVGPGDEVIVPSLTFVACANVIRYVGATPVFADITSPEDWNISVADVESKITSKTKAIMMVHYAGYPCDIDGFLGLSRKHHVEIIEDCSHAPLAKYHNQSVGTFGVTGCFSFFSNKNMTTGEGGMVITSSPDIAARLKILRSHGITSSTYQRFQGHIYGYDVAEIGFNYRLDEIRAAIGIQQLRNLKKYNTLREKIVLHYRSLIAQKIPKVRVPFIEYSGNSSFHIFPVLLPVNIEQRNSILKRMGEAGIQCSIHYRPIHTFTAYEGWEANTPITDLIAGSILTLPLFPTMTEEQINDVVGTLSQCLITSN